MKCAVCVIVKKENDYLREFVEYHLNLGYDKVFIYDNNEPRGEDAQTPVLDYVESGQVEVIKYAQNSYAQRKAYNDCYKNQGDKFDWLSFIDADEFITLKKHKSIKDYLSEPCFKEFNVVRLNWLSFSDSGLIQKDLSRGVVERFTEPFMPLEHFENKPIKSTVRGGLGENLYFKSAHYPLQKVGRSCNALGQEQAGNSRLCQTMQFDVAFISHYPTKTMEEYIENKLRRKGAANRSARSARCRLHLGYFWERNIKTPEKVAFAKQKMGFWEYYNCRYFECEGKVRMGISKFKYKYIYPVLRKIGLLKR